MYNHQKKGHPECYTPNDDPYPLCKGNADQLHECRECCLYEDMDEKAYDDKQRTFSKKSRPFLGRHNYYIGVKGEYSWSGRDEAVANEFMRGKMQRYYDSRGWEGEYF